MKQIALTDEPLSAEARRWVLTLSNGIVVLYLALFLIFLKKVGPEDQDQFLVFHELQAWNSAMFGMAKQWTPLMCGGLSLAGEPQVPFLSLSMMMAYVLGPFWALKAATLIYGLVGWCGAYLYAGLWLRDRAPRSLAASLFVGNGFFICRLGYGHIDFLPFLTLPLLLWVLHGVDNGSLKLPHVRVPIGIPIFLLGAAFALVIDGSPVAIIHLLLWVGIYAFALGVALRSIWPPVVFAAAVALASFLDAGYLWPMLEAQSNLPRLTPDRFTNPLALIWFALLPMRGEVLPTNGLGHELSVFIGPVLAWLLWRDRVWLRETLPRPLRFPLLCVAGASIVLGMGSLTALHIPRFLSLFDLLRPLPGFRSLGVTGRYWGFLALPLSLCSAAVLYRFCARSKATWRWRFLLASTLVLQLGFQLETVLAYWLPSRTYQPSSPATDLIFNGPQSIRYVTRGSHMQGEFITPVQGVLDCYDMDEFVHPDMEPGSSLIRTVTTNDGRILPAGMFSGRFASWSHIALRLTAAPQMPVGTVRLVLGQAYGADWSARGCSTESAGRGNLVLSCPLAQFEGGAVDLNFSNRVSIFAANVSRIAWRIWALAFTIMGMYLAWSRSAAFSNDFSTVDDS